MFAIMLVFVMQRHLIPGLLQEHGLGQDQLVFPPDALQLIADGYTREVGCLLACNGQAHSNDADGD